MAIPEPNIKDMLMIGYGSGLNTVKQAFWDYTRQQDLFFDLSRFKEQEQALWAEILESKLERLTIEQAFIILGMEDPGPDQFPEIETEAPDDEIDF